MKKVVLNLKQYTILEKIEKGRLQRNAIDLNPSFPNPDPTLIVVKGVIDGLETANNNVEATKQLLIEQYAILNQKEILYDDTMTKLGNYVENTANGDVAKILSAAMGVKADPHKSTTVLDKPENLSASAGDAAGSVDLQWNSDPKSSGYNVEMCVDPIEATKWAFKKTSLKSSCTITGLVSGQKVWFRVCAINTIGESAWSNPAWVTVP